LALQPSEGDPIISFNVYTFDHVLCGRDHNRIISCIERCHPGNIKLVDIQMNFYWLTFLKLFIGDDNEATCQVTLCLCTFLPGMNWPADLPEYKIHRLDMIEVNIDLVNFINLFVFTSPRLLRLNGPMFGEELSFVLVR
jgi:hypothetical protein